MDTNGKNLTLITERNARGLVWSPNSKQIAFVSYYYDTPNLFTIDIDSKQVTELMADQLGAMDGQLMWSPAGKSITMAAHEGDIGASDVYQRDIVIIGADGTNITNLTKKFQFFFAQNPVWSPDSKYIAFDEDQGSTYEATSDIYVIDVNSKKLTNLTHNQAGSRMPAWSVDGKHIAFAAPSTK